MKETETMDKYAGLPTTDEGRSELALFELLKILFGPVNDRDRLHAANVILRACAPLPIRRCLVGIDDMTNWLEGLVEVRPSDVEKASSKSG